MRSQPASKGAHMRLLAVPRRRVTSAATGLVAAVGVLVFAGHARAGVIPVSTTAQLPSAVATANAGDQIVLSGGNYVPTAPLNIRVNLTLTGPITAPAARVVGSAVVGPGGAPNEIFAVAGGVTA